MARGSRYFDRGYLSEYLSRQRTALRDGLSKMSADDLLATPVDDLVERMTSLYRIDPPSLDENGLTVDDPVEELFERPGSFGDGPYKFPGARIHVVVPMSGNRDVLAFTPSRSLMARFDGDVRPRTFEFDLELVPVPADGAAAAAKVREGIDSFLRSWRQQLGYVRADIDQYNRELPKVVREEVERRRDQALRFASMRGAIDLPLTRRDAPGTVLAGIGLTEKRVPIPAPATTNGYRDEPRLDEKSYERVLEVLRSMSLVIERSPAAFVSMEEEHIRFHFLVTLNALFSGLGAATGETFNQSGKTDILLRYQDSNLFVAECKIWHGQKEFTKAIGQLLGYLTWRDSRAAIVLFVREKDFGLIVAKAIDTIKAYPSYKRTIVEREDGGRFVLHLPEETNREVHVALLAFHVRPTDDANSGEAI